MKRFRGKEVIGWKTITERSEETFDEKVNQLMEHYDFEDFQFSTCFDDSLRIVVFTATMLLKQK